MKDTFETSNLTPGCETLIWTSDASAIVGVVATIDEEARSVTFADGRVYVFPPIEPTPEEVAP